MAYMVIIIKASQRYAGRAWVNYDNLYHHQAAAKKCREWSQPNTSLFNLCFMGHLKDIEQCHHCGTTSHASGDCLQGDEGEEKVSTRLLHSLETVAAALADKAGHSVPREGRILGEKRTMAFVTNTMSRTAITHGVGIVMSVCYVEEIILRFCVTNQASGKEKEVQGTEVESRDHTVHIRKQTDQ